MPGSNIATARTSGKPTYRYYYTQPRPGDEGAKHSVEIEYALGNLPPAVYRERLTKALESMRELFGYDFRMRATTSEG